MRIDVDNIVFGYSPAKTVLNGISLKGGENKVISIVGASGSGKSTFLRLLCGILKKTKDNLFSGTITIDGMTASEYVRKGKVGLMFQEPNLLPNLTVRKNISFPLKLRKQNCNGEVDALLRTVSLQEFSDYLPFQLSGGMKTRVALARTFSTKPDLLLLDEPFSSLDIRWRFTLYRELVTLQQKYQSTVIMVTHDIQEALLLSNHILVFGRNGSVVSELLIDKPLPRVFEEDSMKSLQEEYHFVQDLIMRN